MNLRLKLLIAFALFALAGLTFFGYVAYQQAREATQKTEAFMLQSLSAAVVDELMNDTGPAHTVDAMAQWITETRYEDFVLVLSDAKGRVVTATPKSGLPDTLLATIDFSDTAGPLGYGGQQRTGRHIYTWTTLPVADQPYHLTIIHQTGYSETVSFLREVGPSLVVTALIVIWLASWSAMYVASLVERLHQQTNALRFQALHDPLTGLPNRALLNDRLEHAMNVADRDEKPLALCFLDLNRFKEVNDSMGHHHGDRLLVEVSERLKNKLRRSDTIARLGGDEFALILRDCDGENARRVAEKLIAAIEEPVDIDGTSFYVSGSFGISMYPDQAADAQGLIQRADVAMYAAKRDGTAVEFFTQAMESYNREKLLLANELREAILHDELEVHYQPRVNFATQSIVGIEALARWPHEKYGLISPVNFISLSEHAGLIDSLTNWIVNRALADFADISQLGYNLNLSINLSACNLQDAHFTISLATAIQRHGVSAQNVILELTESAFMIDLSRTKEVLKKLDTLGFGISIDDFGTGFSSFANLKHLPISEIKVDRSFVTNMTANANDASIVRATVELGRSLGLNVVAEGVETEMVMEALMHLGCEEAQGYHICKPLPKDDLIQWLVNAEEQDGVQATGTT